jgi:hypothetical protein
MHSFMNITYLFGRDIHLLIELCGSECKLNIFVHAIEKRLKFITGLQTLYHANISDLFLKEEHT